MSLCEQRVDPQFGDDVTGFSHWKNLLRDVKHMPISNLYLTHQELGHDQLELKLDWDFDSRGSKLVAHQLEVWNCYKYYLHS